VYGLSYPKATLVEKAGKSGYYACVTIPVALRPFFKNRRQQYKALGKDIRTTREAYETGRLREKETLIWREFDEADLANHPLAVAYLALEDKLAKQSDASPFWSINDLFNHIKRFDLEDDLRQRTAEEMGVARSAFDDFEVGGWASAKYSELEDFLRVFLEEFRKLSEERFSPKKRGKLFSDVAKEYFESALFLKNKKTNQPKRQKTLAKERRNIEVFMRWAGGVSLDEFTHGLATNFAEALINPDNNLVSFRGEGVSAETLDGYFSSIKNVLVWARSKDYLATNPWSDLTLAGYGAAKKKYRDWNIAELSSLFRLDMPKQDKLLLAILACTGARLDEIATLEWSQVHSAVLDGKTINWLDIKESVVKNDSSKRLIPIVPLLAKRIEKFSSQIQATESNRLFTYLKDKDGKAENKASRALMAHCRKISSDSTFAVHGLRHTFNTLCRNASIDWELREFIVGRSGQGQGAKYGEAAHVATYLKELAKIDFSFIEGT
jgi:integrase